MLESMNFSFTQLNLPLLIPMCISLFGGIILLIIGAFNKKPSRELYIAITLLFVTLNLGFLLLGSDNNALPQLGFFNSLLFDGVSFIAQMIILIATFIILLFFLHKNTCEETQSAEFYALILFAIAGFGFMVSTKNLIIILLGLECSSLSIYTLIALHNKSKAFEASIKYFVMGALATAIYSFGAMILYATTGSIDISHIAEFFLKHHYEPSFLAFASFIFLLCALGFKISIVPFHTWGPDTYEGSNSLLAAFIAIVPKVAAFSVVFRIFSTFLESHTILVYTLYIFAILTMSIPNLIALVQKDVKRMLAYSSISHSGFILGAILINATDVMFLYWFFFLFANLGAFGILWLYIDCRENNNGHSFESLSGMIKTDYSLAIMLTLFMFALAGIPPFCVFWGKMYLMQNVLNAGYVTLAVFMAVNSMISAYYYLKVIIYVFAKNPKNLYTKTALGYPSKIALGIALIVSLGCIFMAQDLLHIASKYIGGGF